MTFFEDAMYMFAGDHSRGDWADALGNLAYVLANLNTCNFRKPFRDMIDFCKVETPEDMPLPITGPGSFLSDDINSEHFALKQSTWEPDMSSELSDKIVKCSWKAVLDNTTKNAFILMGRISNFALTIADFPGPDADNIYSQTVEFGEDMGTFVRVALGFIE